MFRKDVIIAFTIAGILPPFFLQSSYTALFSGSGGENAANPRFIAVLDQILVRSVAAFFTFISSMGTIPLAALLFEHGVSFIGVMAFICSDVPMFR